MKKLPFIDDTDLGIVAVYQRANGSVLVVSSELSYPAHNSLSLRKDFLFYTLYRRLPLFLEIYANVDL